MNKTSLRLPAVIVAALLILPHAAQAGLIELIEFNTIGNVTLTIDGNRLRLTDNTGGSGLLRVIDNPGGGANPATQLGLAGNWDTSIILSVPLQSTPLLPTTRLDSLFDGKGLSTGGNGLRELAIIDRVGVGYIFDLDQVQTIGGTVPEPTSIMLLGLLTPAYFAVRPQRISNV